MVKVYGILVAVNDNLEGDGLNAEQETRIRELFAESDTDASGNLSHAEFAQMVSDLSKASAVTGSGFFTLRNVW